MKTNPQLEALRRAAEQPVDGPLYDIEDLEGDLGSRRSVELFLESGELAGFKIGRRWKVTSAARNDFIRRCIAKRIAELEGSQS